MATKITTDKIGKDGGKELTLPSSSQTLPAEGELSNLQVNSAGEIQIGSAEGGTSTAKKPVKYYMDKETNTEDMIEELKEYCDKEKNRVKRDNKEYYDFGSYCLCWGIIDKEDIIQKLYNYSFEDKEYLSEILFEYLELIEEKEIGLCGIVETLEDRGVII